MTGHSWHGGELRWDRLAGEWTILAPGRAARPQDDGTCPFCPGPGEDTPPETWRTPAEGTWRIRAVPNRFALSDHHEVLIESPDHHWDPATATDDEVDELFHAWQTRHRALRRNAAQVVVFRNRGHAAGTSLSHPHSQLCGLPVVSAAAVREAEYRRDHFARRGRHFTDDLIDAELAHGDRIVHLDEHVVVFCPFAPAAGFEFVLAPRHSQADFAGVAGAERRAAATALRRALGALRAELDDPAYNLVVRTAPTGWEEAPFLCWSIVVRPRLSIAAGLEIATGVPVVTATPEAAAQRLRARLRQSDLLRSPR